LNFESCGGDFSSILSKFIKECECAIGVCKGVVDTNYPKFSFFFKIEKDFYSNFRVYVMGSVVAHV
jgi:hypothetical protein